MSIHTVVKNLSQTLNAEEGDTSKAEVLLASAIAICYLYQANRMALMVVLISTRIIWTTLNALSMRLMKNS